RSHASLQRKRVHRAVGSGRADRRAGSVRYSASAGRDCETAGGWINSTAAGHISDSRLRFGYGGRDKQQARHAHLPAATEPNQSAVRDSHNRRWNADDTGSAGLLIDLWTRTGDVSWWIEDRLRECDGGPCRQGADVSGLWAATEIHRDNSAGRSSLQSTGT